MGIVSYLPTAGIQTEQAHETRDQTVHDEGVPTDVVQDDATQAETEQAEAARAEKVSMNALTRRGMSRWELGEKLLARDLDSDVVERELDRLERVGLIDDAALAETIVRTQRERKGLGRAALNSELRRRKIDPVIIELALEQPDDDDERTRAAELAERRARQLTSLDHATAQRRLSGYLMRKGYPGDIVREAVDRALPRAGSGSGVRFR